MSTLAAMIADIEDDMERSDTDAIRKKILRAVEHYQGERFYFNESRDETFNVTAGGQDYTFQTEFFEIDGVYITYGTSILDVEPVDYRVIELLRGGSSSQGVPTKYAYINRSMAFYPESDATYAVRITGHIRVDAPAADDEADNPWMTDAYDLIKARAKAKLFAERYRDVEGATIERTIEADALNDLRARTASKVGTGTIRSTHF